MGRLEAAEARDALVLQEQLQRQPSRGILKPAQRSDMQQAHMQQPMRQQEQMMMMQRQPPPAMGGFVLGPGIMDYTR